MKYTDISDNPKRGWAFASDLEMQKSSAKMVSEKLSMRPQAIFDLFQRAEIKISSYFYKLIPHNNIKQLTETIDVIFDCIMNDTEEPLKKYLGITADKNCL